MLRTEDFVQDIIPLLVNTLSFSVLNLLRDSKTTA